MRPKHMDSSYETYTHVHTWTPRMRPTHMDSSYETYTHVHTWTPRMRPKHMDSPYETYTMQRRHRLCIHVLLTFCTI